jgi:methyltransferase
MTIDPVAAAVLAAIALERAAELALARRNTRALLARGGHEVGRAHYPLIVALHAAWLVCLVVLGHDRRPDPVLLALFGVVEIGRVWVLATLGRRWTTRIIVVPGEALVARGPYRILRHPNYAVVAAEILVLPLAFGLPLAALVFSVLNALVLAIRIRAETAALHANAAPPLAGRPAL